MRSKRYLWNICMQIYKEMYKEAKPSADFVELMNLGITKKENWFMNYYLSTEKQQQIINEICKAFKCSKQEKRIIENEIYLGSAPTGVKK